MEKEQEFDFLQTIIWGNILHGGMEGDFFPAGGIFFGGVMNGKNGQIALRIDIQSDMEIVIISFPFDMGAVGTAFDEDDIASMAFIPASIMGIGMPIVS